MIFNAHSHKWTIIAHGLNFNWKCEWDGFEIEVMVS